MILFRIKHVLGCIVKTHLLKDIKSSFSIVECIVSGESIIPSVSCFRKFRPATVAFSFVEVIIPLGIFKHNVKLVDRRQIKTCSFEKIIIKTKIIISNKPFCIID